MSNDLFQLKKVFEYELKRKLRQTMPTRNEEIRCLMNAFKFYDHESSSIINKNDWIKGVIKTGLSGFGMEHLLNVFNMYDINNTGFINYINFVNYLYNNELLIPIPKEFIEKNIDLITKQNNNRVKSPYIEFQPPGLYERSIEMLENNNQRNSPNNNQYQEVNNYNNNNNNYSNQNNNYIEMIQKQSPNTPFAISSKINKNIINNLNTNNNNISNNNVKDVSIQNNSLSNNNDSSFFTRLLLLFQTKINIENGVTYYIYAEKLKSYENKSDKTIDLNSFYSSLKDFNISINLNDLTKFFNYIDKTKSNKVPTETILEVIRGNLSEKRKNLIEYTFSLIDKDKMGRVPINIIRSLYNCKLHPDVYVGVKKEEDIYKEFCYTFDMYCNLYNINEYMTYEQFVNYYWGISASILDDNYFEDILNGVWNHNIIVNKNINPKINDNLSINQNYNENYRKELIGNRINNDSNSYLNNKYVNDQNQNNYNYINYKNTSNLERNKSQSNYNFSRYTPIPQENEFNINKPVKELELFKQMIISRGQKGIFTFQKILCLYDKNMSGELDYDKYNELLEMFNINMSKQDTTLIFGYFDKEKKGIIKYDDLIKELISNISKNRELLIRKIYDNFSKDNNYKVYINDLKQNFRAYNHPEVKNRFKSEEEVYYDFLESLDIFKNYKNIIKRQNTEILSYEDFLDFFKEISMSIIDDKLFEDLLTNCWSINLEKNYENYLDNNSLRIRTANQILNNQKFNYYY